MRKERDYSILIVCAALIIVIINACFFEHKKEGFFLDEKATFYIANADCTSFGELLNTFSENNNDFEQTLWDIIDSAPMVSGVRYTFDEVNATLDAQLGDKFTYLDTLIFTIVDSHPPLYYLVFNSINSLIPGIDAKNTGFLINILSLLLVCFLLYKIILLFTKDKLCGVIGMLFYGLSYDFINCVMYFRMYALLTFWMMLLLYLYMLMVYNGFEISKKWLFKICAVEFLAMFTQFYAALFIFPLFAITTIMLKTHKKTVKDYLVSQIITALIYLFIWPISIIQITLNQSGKDVMNNMESSQMLLRIKDFYGLLKLSIFSGSTIYFFLTLVIVTVCGVMLLIKYSKDGLRQIIGLTQFELCLYLIVPVTFFYLASVYVSPWVIDRYVMPAIPGFCAIITLAFWICVRRFIKNKWICTAFMIVLILISYVHSLSYEPRYAYPVTSEKKTFIEDNQDKEALIIEGRADSEYVEILADLGHPYWTRIIDDGLTDYLAEGFESGNEYVIYLNKDCNMDEIEKCFMSFGYSLEKSDYSTDFFDVFIYRAQD